MGEALTLAHGTLRTLRGDLVQQRVDAIVNAANGTLLGGGGVDGAIHRAAGPELLAFCRALPATRGQRCATGDVVVTPGFGLPAAYVLHAVGPVYYRMSDAAACALLRQVHERALAEADRVGARSVAFPAI